jgi:hypothetical protein
LPYWAQKNPIRYIKKQPESHKKTLYIIFEMYRYGRLIANYKDGSQELGCQNAR